MQSGRCINYDGESVLFTAAWNKERISKSEITLNPVTFEENLKRATIHISGKVSKENMNKLVDQHMITTSVMLLFSTMKMARAVSWLLLVNLNTTELLNFTTQEQNHGHTKTVSKNMNGFMASQQSISMVLLTCLVVKNFQKNSGFRYKSSLLLNSKRLEIDFTRWNSPSKVVNLAGNKVEKFTLKCVV